MARRRRSLRTLLPLLVAVGIGCGRDPLAPGRLPPGYGQIVKRIDLNGDGREDALLANPNDCGALGCSCVAWVSGPEGYRAVAQMRCSATVVGTTATRGYLDLGCDTRVQDDDTSVLIHALVPYRWNGSTYVSELAPLEKGSPRACEIARVRSAAPIWTLPARDVAVYTFEDDRWVLGPLRTPTRGELRVGETFEPVRDVVDSAGERWTAVLGRGWVEAFRIECVDPFSGAVSRP